MLKSLDQFLLSMLDYIVHSCNIFLVYCHRPCLCSVTAVKLDGTLRKKYAKHTTGSARNSLKGNIVDLSV